MRVTVGVAMRVGRVAMRVTVRVATAAMRRRGRGLARGVGTMERRNRVRRRDGNKGELSRWGVDTRTKGVVVV